MRFPKVHILLSTYNGIRFLQAQLDSLQQQDYPNLAIYIRDDGSKDGTIEFLQRYQAQFDNTKLSIGENLGYIRSFFELVRTCEDQPGDLYAFCDQDDVWRPDKLASMAERFRADPSLLLLHSDARLVDAGGESLGCSLFDALQLTAEEKQAIHADRAFEVVLRRSFVTGATAAFRRELVELALPVAQDWIHDEWLAAVAAAAGRVDFIDEPLIDYRQHDANQIGMRRRTLAMKWRDLLLPRGRLLSDEAGRLRRLEAFLAEAGLRDGVERAVQIRHKRSHFERRVAIGRLPRLRRLLPVLHEAREGCYGLYGTGGRSVLRDLLRHD